MELGFRIPIVSGIPDSFSCIPDSTAQDSKVHQQKFPRFQNSDSLSWGDYEIEKLQRLKLLRWSFESQIENCFKTFHAPRRPIKDNFNLYNFGINDKWKWNEVTKVDLDVLDLGGFPFVRTDRPDLSRRSDNFPFNQNSPARSVKSWIVCTKEMVLQQKLLEKAYFIFKLTGRAVVRPTGSVKWKAPLDYYLCQKGWLDHLSRYWNLITIQMHPVYCKDFGFLCSFSGEYQITPWPPHSGEEWRTGFRTVYSGSE